MASGRDGLGPVRRAITVVALLAIGVGLAGQLRSDEDRSARVASATACPPGTDLLAVEASTGERDDQYFDGLYSVGVSAVGSGSIAWLHGVRDVVRDPALAPDGREVAVAWADGDYESSGPSSESIWVLDRSGGPARVLTSGLADRSPRWSPDGRWIAFVRRDGQRASLAVVPSAGGPVRSLASGEPPGSFVGSVWTSTTELLVWSGDREANATTIRRVDLDGGDEQVATVAGVIRGAAIAPGTGELLVDLLPEPSLPTGAHLAVDLADGRSRDVDGPAGTLVWTADGERLYLLDEQGVVHRARYDGTAVAPVSTVRTGVDDAFDLSVATCPADAVEADVAPEERPLIGTDWRLGPRRLAVVAATPTAGCEEPACTDVRIVAADASDDPDGSTEPCAVATGTLRGSAVAIDRVAIGNDPACARYEAWADDSPPVGLRVEGGRLHLALAQPRSAEPYEVTFGAFATGERAPGPEAFDAAELDAFEATTTTTAPPALAPCAEVSAFATRLAGSSVVLDGSTAATPADLAEVSTVVVHGRLVDGGLISDARPPAEASLTYALVVDDVLRGRAPGVEVGAKVQVVLPFRYVDGHLPPALGALGSADGTTESGALPAIAFLTTDGATWPGDLLVATGEGLTIGCPGEPVGGLTGRGAGWTARELDELAEQVRG